MHGCAQPGGVAGIHKAHSLMDMHGLPCARKCQLVLLGVQMALRVPVLQVSVASGWPRLCGRLKHNCECEQSRHPAGDNALSACLPLADHWMVPQHEAPQGLSEGAHIIRNSGLAPPPLPILLLCLQGTQIPPALDAEGCGQKKQPHHVCHLPCAWPAHMCMHAITVTSSSLQDGCWPR